MKKILVTGPFEGAVTLEYGEAGIGEETYPPLLSVDFRGAVLNDAGKLRILEITPTRYAPGFEDGFPTKLKVFVEELEVDFEEDFWKPYGKKVNKDRGLKEWNKLTKVERAMAVNRIPAYLRFLSRAGTGKADPENYLHKKYFKNDYDNL